MMKHSGASSWKRLWAIPALLLYLALPLSGCSSRSAMPCAIQTPQAAVCCQVPIAPESTTEIGNVEPTSEEATPHPETPSLPAALEPQHRYRVAITGIRDGDTINVLWYEREITGVRLLGIDTPERNEPGFIEAKEYLRELLGDNPVELVFPRRKVRRDGFGRLLAEVWADGVNVNEKMLESGLAKPYRRK